MAVAVEEEGTFTGSEEDLSFHSRDFSLQTVHNFKGSRPCCSNCKGKPPHVAWRSLLMGTTARWH